jgi:hypothetical protein
LFGVVVFFVKLRKKPSHGFSTKRTTTMGNVPSVPTGEIQRVAEEVMKAFVPAYTKQFALALVKEAEAKRNTSPKQLFLKDPPVPSEPLMTGYLTKQGGVVKSWKKRYFVALNKVRIFLSFVRPLLRVKCNTHL